MSEPLKAGRYLCPKNVHNAIVMYVAPKSIGCCGREMIFDRPLNKEELAEKAADDRRAKRQEV